MKARRAQVSSWKTFCTFFSLDSLTLQQAEGIKWALRELWIASPNNLEISKLLSIELKNVDIKSVENRDAVFIDIPCGGKKS